MNSPMALRTCAAVSLCALFAATSARAVPQAAEAEAEVPGPRNVAILIFPGVELLDFAGPGETFAAVRSDAEPAFRVYTVAETMDPVTSMGFVSITPGYTLDDCPEPDIVVAPGGKVPLRSEAVRSWLAAKAEGAELMMSVCNGAGLLGQAGLLENLEVTTHHGSLQRLAALVPSAAVYSNRRFVDSGRVLTTAGVSAGIDGALHVVSRMIGAEAAQETARYMEYDWRPDEIAKLHEQPGARVGARATWILEAVAEHGLTAALATYREQEAAGGEEFVQAHGEQALNSEGYMMLSRQRLAAAVALFEFIVAAHPSSANAHDSLSEAYEVAGQAERAFASAVEALKLLKHDERLSESRRALIEKVAGERILRVKSGEEVLFACKPCDRECDDARFGGPGRCPDPGCGMVLLPVLAQE